LFRNNNNKLQFGQSAESALPQFLPEMGNFNFDIIVSKGCDLAVPERHGIHLEIYSG